MTAPSDQPLRLVVLLPVYNDWASFSALLGRIDAACAESGVVATVVAVDDGSTEPRGALPDEPRRALEAVDVLALHRNVGHQRAIALGLAFVEAERACDAVLVMDADGEDRPEDIPTLVARFRAADGARVVFAKRSRRMESVAFRFCYRAYQLVHLLLTGIRVEVGNFSITPARRLPALTAMPELWNHYAASVFQSRVPYETVPIDRGARLAGRSHMRFVSLVVHGLSAISVFSEIVAVRALIAAGAFATLVMAGALGGFLVPGALPEWAWWTILVAVVVALQLFGVAATFVFHVLRTRNDLGFLPARDFRYFVAGVDTLAGSRAAAALRR